MIMGLTFWYLNENESALEHYDESLKMKMELLGVDHLDVAHLYSRVGLVYWNLGDHQLAIQHHKKALHIYQRCFGQNHPYVAASYNNMGLVYKNQGELTKALECYKESLQINLKVKNENHPDIAQIYNNLGTIYLKQGVYNEALKCHLSSLKIRESVLGEGHPDIALSYKYIGHVYETRQENEKAVEFFLKASDLLTKHNPSHPDLATIQQNIENCLSATYVSKPTKFTKPSYSCLLDSENRFIYDISAGIQAQNHLLINNSFFHAICLLYGEASFHQSCDQHLLQLLDGLSKQETFLNHRLFAASETYRMIDIDLANSMIDAHKYPDNEGIEALQVFSEEGKHFVRDFPLEELEGFIATEFECFYDYLINKYAEQKNSYYLQFLKNTHLLQGTLGQDPSCVLLEKLQVLTQNFLEEVYGLTTSSWSSDDSIDELLEALRLNGPIIIGGQFGKTFYEQPPIELANGISDRTVGFWMPNTKTINHHKTHFVILVGAAKIKTSSNGGGEVYFFDPNDLSKSKTKVLYKISYQVLTASLKRSELLKDYAIHLKNS